MNQERSPKHDAEIASEDIRLKERIAVTAAPLHQSLEAWRQLGITGLVTSLFQAIERRISRLYNPDPPLVERVRSFLFDDEDDDEQHKRFTELEVRLRNAGAEVANYRQRVDLLKGPHREALDQYSAWIEALQQRIFQARGTDSILRIVSQGLEYASAQQQLARMLMLQEAELRILEQEIGQVILMTGALINNFSAAKELLTTRFEDGRRALKRHSRR